MRVRTRAATRAAMASALVLTGCGGGDGSGASVASASAPIAVTGAAPTPTPTPTPTASPTVAAVSASVATTAPSSLYALAWEETFGASAVDTTRWAYRMDVKGFSAQQPANAVIDNGQLSLLMRQESASGQSYTGGGLISRRQFGYGYFEVRAKMTDNTGWHSAFWMMANGPATAAGALELDAFESDTGLGAQATSGLTVWGGQAAAGGAQTRLATARCSRIPGANLDGAYHLYGADWREGAVDFYFDGLKYCTLAYPTDQYRQDLINIWLSTIAYTQPISVGGSPQLFDDVRFYQRDLYVMNGRDGYGESGAGWDDSAETGFGLLPQRRSCSAGAASSYAPAFLQAGSYHVYLWKAVDTGGDSQAQVTVRSASDTTTQMVDFTSGASGWVDLGVHSFAQALSSPAQSVTDTLRSGCQSAGAVKFVRAA